MWAARSIPTCVGTVGRSWRVIALFRDELHYRYLGDWSDREDNSNIEEILLTDWLGKCGYNQAQVSMALHKLRTEASNHNRTLYGNNKAVYQFLRYGVPVKTEAGKVTETVHLINWKEPEKNDFVIAEEVTLRGNRERRPDLVLYVNGIAIGVLELKNSRVSIGDSIRQNLSNQQPEFNEWFMAPSARQRNISSSGRKTSRITPASKWISTCSNSARSVASLS